MAGLIARICNALHGSGALRLDTVAADDELTVPPLPAPPAVLLPVPTPRFRYQATPSPALIARAPRPPNTLVPVAVRTEVTDIGGRSASAAFDRTVAELAPLRASLVHHPVYAALVQPAALQVFMANHVFAVWDFMSLLKALQRMLTGTTHPWLPPDDIAMARLINEIVLGEETDEVLPGKYMSHFQLYMQAMGQVGADRKPMLTFVSRLRVGMDIEQALMVAGVPIATADFVSSTMATCHGGVVEVAAAFLLGREDLVPSMFRPILASLEESGIPCDLYRLYLERHVHLDEEEHGPAARRLLEGLCGTSSVRWAAATEAARTALEARRALWDGVLDLIPQL